MNTLGSGNILSMMPFGLADALFSTLDGQSMSCASVFLSFFLGIFSFDWLPVVGAIPLFFVVQRFHVQIVCILKTFKTWFNSACGVACIRMPVLSAYWNAHGICMCGCAEQACGLQSLCSSFGGSALQLTPIACVQSSLYGTQQDIH